MAQTANYAPREPPKDPVMLINTIKPKREPCVPLPLAMQEDDLIDDEESELETLKSTKVYVRGSKSYLTNQDDKSLGPMSPTSALNLDPNLENHGVVLKIRDILQNNVAGDREAFKMSVARVQGL
jgi:hypothetical protein